MEEGYGERGSGHKVMSMVMVYVALMTLLQNFSCDLSPSMHYTALLDLGQEFAHPEVASNGVVEKVLSVTAASCTSTSWPLQFNV